MQPDLIIIDAESPSRNTPEGRATMSADHPRPVVMFATERASDTIREVMRAGVSARVVDGIDPARVQPILDVAVARFEEFQKLRGELAWAHRGCNAASATLIGSVPDGWLVRLLPAGTAHPRARMDRHPGGRHRQAHAARQHTGKRGRIGSMNPTDAIRETGRGRYSARPLDRAQACSIFGQMLDGSVDPLRLGALLMAWRIKGESIDELAGFLDATHASMDQPWAGALDPARPLVVIPSYNGARSRPNLLPLLAHALREAGLQVLVHGVLDDPRRVTSAQVFAAMGEPLAGSLAEALDRLRSHSLAFIGIDALAPRLARLLALRWQLGVRSSGHTVVKMLDPVPHATLRLVSVTHPDSLDAMRAYYAAHPSRIVLMRGTEGEAVRRLQNPQAVEYLDASGCHLLLPAEEAPAPAVAADALDAASTARWSLEALEGRQGGVPAAIRAQAGRIAVLARA